MNWIHRHIWAILGIAFWFGVIVLGALTIAAGEQNKGGGEVLVGVFGLVTTLAFLFLSE